jgi:hypothetical protein
VWKWSTGLPTGCPEISGRVFENLKGWISIKRNRSISGKVTNDSENCLQETLDQDTNEAKIANSGLDDQVSKLATNDGEHCLQENLNRDTKEAKISNSGLKKVVALYWDEVWK